MDQSEFGYWSVLYDTSLDLFAGVFGSFVDLFSFMYFMYFIVCIFKDCYLIKSIDVFFLFL